MEWKCKNCGKILEDSLLTHCSVGCRFESYLKSQSVNPLPSQKIISKSQNDLAKLVPTRPRPFLE